MGMRLPFLSEIKQSIEFGTTKDWEKFGNRYWSAEQGDLFCHPISPDNATGGNIGHWVCSSRVIEGIS